MMALGEQHSLSGQVAVVTGGSRGIGRAIAQALAEAGADVVVASRKAEACQLAAAQIAESTGRRTLAVTTHVGRWENCDALVHSSLSHFGQLDILINNAGMSPIYDTLDNVSEELYDKTLAVNLKGPFRLGVLSASHMSKHGGGTVINIGTIGSLIASPNELPYACAKAGLNALTVGLAEAFAPNVRVNAILPGAVRTEITNSWSHEMLSGSYVPLKRLGEVEDIAPLAVFLASGASSYVTGTIIRVDGGMTRKL